MLSDDESTIEQVRKWIKLSGFPLEMRVAAAFREHDRPSVEQGFEYTDPITSDIREGDVLVRWPIDDRKPEVVAVTECKSTTAPWVIFMRGGRPEHDDLDRKAVLSPLPDGYLDSLRSLFHHGLDQTALFQSGRAEGYAITQKRDKKGDGPDLAHQAVRQVVSATVGVLNDTDALATMIMPVVVTTSPLFECSLNADNDIELREVDRSAVRVSTQARSSVLVHIVHESRISYLADNLMRVALAVHHGPPPAW